MTNAGLSRLTLPKQRGQRRGGPWDAFDPMVGTRASYARGPAAGSGAGWVGGVLMFGCSLTPSLLPKSWLMQGAVSGLAALAGCAVGATAGWVASRLLVRLRASAVRLRRPGGAAPEPSLGPLAATSPHAASGAHPKAESRQRMPAWAWVGGVLASVAALRTHYVWQADARALIGWPAPAWYEPLAMVAVAVAVLVGGLALARVIRQAACWSLRRLRGLFPNRVAGPASVLTFALFAGVGVHGTWSGAMVPAVTAAFTDINAGTSAAAPPCRPPCSRIPFSTLGRFGQRFISDSPTLTELAAFGGRSAVRPLRIYAGLRSAPTLRAEADLIVAELERLGGFDRKTLLIATSTGTGWVDPNAVAALEYMYNGDTAAVSMQYSSLPSPVSFVVDRSEVTRASRVLLRQVRAAWLRRPAQTRPKLLVFGESLGALGSQSSFRDLADVTRRVDGALWEGSPANAPLFAAHPSTSPTPAGVLFADHATMLHRLRRLHPVKVVFLQHPSDPVPRWSPDLLVRRPNWLRGGPAGRGDDVSARMRWYPLVTFLQVTADLAWATRVPRGHGHNYHVDAADGWARIVPAPGWTTRDTRRLREALAHRARL